MVEKRIIKVPEPEGIKEDEKAVELVNEIQGYDKEFKDMFGEEIQPGDIIIYPYGFDRAKYLAIAIVRGLTNKSIKVSSYRLKSQWSCDFDVVKTHVKKPERVIVIYDYSNIPDHVIQALQKELE